MFLCFLISDLDFYSHSLYNIFVCPSWAQNWLNKVLYTCIMYHYFLHYSICFLNSVLGPFQDHFSSYETGQSVDGAKTRESREKTPDTPTSRTWLVSHVASAGARTHTRHSGEMID